jgi:hypothetical protein
MDKANTISTTAGALMGAGLTLIQNNPTLGLELIGVGTVLTVLVAYLQKKGLDVQTAPLG